MKDKNRKSGYHFSLKNPQYENCQVLSPEGQLMFRCCRKKAEWYLNKNLGKTVAEEPFTIQLTFVPKGVGHINDPYFLQVMKNRCVVCGGEDSLTRHHIVPYCYRKFFPEKLKNHRSYDVMALCIPCHHSYEEHAQELKKSLGNQYNAPVSGAGIKYDKLMAKARGAALAILEHGDKIPAERKQKLINSIVDYLQREPTDEDLKSLVNYNPYNFGNYVHHGAIIIEQIDNIDEFVQQWRKHFIQTMNPQFLPSHWNIHRPSQPKIVVK